MLKITVQPGTKQATFLLEGALVGPWIDELRRQLAESPMPVYLDLSGISFMDQHAVALLEEAVGHGTRIIACSNFAALMLQRDPR
jgi:anti-anti-sigma regulatory factor